VFFRRNLLLSSLKNLSENYRGFTLSAEWAAKAAFFKGVFALAGGARKRKNTLSPTPLGAKYRTW